MGDFVDHDRLFKELLENFFAEFVAAFFPQVDQAADFSNIRFLQQELFTDVIVGDKHRVNLLVEAKLKDEPGFILIHMKTKPMSSMILRNTCSFIVPASIKNTGAPFCRWPFLAIMRSGMNPMLSNGIFHSWMSYAFDF